jgi:hypothetical protein
MTVRFDGGLYDSIDGEKQWVADRLPSKLAANAAPKPTKLALRRYIAVVRCEHPHKACVPMRQAMAVQNPTNTSASIIAAIALLA